MTLITPRFPLPANITAVDEPDIYDAVYDFIDQYAKPAMAASTDTGRIFAGNTSRMVLPKDNEYAIMTIINSQRVGSTIERYDATGVARGSDGTLTLSELIKTDVQLDFFSDPHSANDKARRRAQCVETVARSSLASQFFNQYSIGLLDVTTPTSMVFVGDANQYVNRWMLTLTLCFWSNVQAGLPWFDSINLRRVENVDVHHKP